MCAGLGGYLPEPRDEIQNNFLDKVTATANMFYLGVTDRSAKGNWMWETDDALVTWKNWVTVKDNQGEGFDAQCAVMIKKKGATQGLTSKAWLGHACTETGKDMSLVCEIGKNLIRAS